MHKIFDQQRFCKDCDVSWYYAYLTIRSFTEDSRNGSLGDLIQWNIPRDVPLESPRDMAAAILLHHEIISTDLLEVRIYGTNIYFILDPSIAGNYTDNILLNNINIPGLEFWQTESTINPAQFCGTGNAFIYTHFSVCHLDYQTEQLIEFVNFNINFDTAPSGDNYTEADSLLSDNLYVALKDKLFNEYGYKGALILSKKDNIIKIGIRKEFYEGLLYDFPVFRGDEVLNAREDCAIYPRKMRFYEMEPGMSDWESLIFSNVQNTSVDFLGYTVSGFNNSTNSIIRNTSDFLERYYFLKSNNTSTELDRVFAASEAVHPLRYGEKIRLVIDADIIPMGGINNKNLSHLLLDNMLSFKVNSAEFSSQQRREEEERCRLILEANGLDISNFTTLSGVFLGETPLFPAKIEDARYNFNIKNAGVISGGEIPAKVTTSSSNTLKLPEKYGEGQITFPQSSLQQAIITEPYLNVREGSASEGIFLISQKGDKLNRNWKTYHPSFDGVESENGDMLLWGGVTSQPTAYVKSEVFIGDVTGISFFITLPNLPYFPSSPLRWQYLEGDNHQADGLMESFNSIMLQEGILNLLFIERIGNRIFFQLNPLLFHGEDIFNRNWNITGLLGVEATPRALFFELNEEEIFGEIEIELPEKYKLDQGICEFIDECLEDSVCKSKCKEVFLDASFIDFLEEELPDKGEETACDILNRYERTRSVEENQDEEFLDVEELGNEEILKRGIQRCRNKFRLYKTMDSNGVLSSFWKAPATFPLSSPNFSYCPVNLPDNQGLLYLLEKVLRENLVLSKYATIELGEDNVIRYKVSPTLFYQHWGVELTEWNGHKTYNEELESNSENRFQLVRLKNETFEDIIRERDKTALSRKLNFCDNLFDPVVELAWCGVDYNCEPEYYFTYFSFKEYEGVDKEYEYPLYNSEEKTIEGLWSIEETGIAYQDLIIKNAGRHLFIWIPSDKFKESKVELFQALRIEDPDNLLLNKEYQIIPYTLRRGNDPYLFTEFSISKKQYNHARPLEGEFQEWKFEIPATGAEDNPYEQDEQVASIIEELYNEKIFNGGYDAYVFVERVNNRIRIYVDRLAYPFFIYDYPEFENGKALRTSSNLLAAKNFYHFSSLQDNYGEWFEFERIPDEEAPSVSIDLDLITNNINLEEDHIIRILNNPDSNDWIIASNIVQAFQERIGYGMSRYLNTQRTGNRIRFTLNNDFVNFGVSGLETDRWTPNMTIDGRAVINKREYNGISKFPLVFMPKSIYSSQEKPLEIVVRINEFSSRPSDDFYNLNVQFGKDRYQNILLPNIPLGKTKKETAENIAASIHREFNACEITAETKTRIDKEPADRKCDDLNFESIFDPFVEDNIREVVSRFEPFLEDIRPSNEKVILNQLSFQINQEFRGQVDKDALDLALGEIRNKYISINTNYTNPLETTGNEEVYVVLKISPSYAKENITWNKNYKPHIASRTEDLITVSPRNINPFNLRITHSRIFTAGKFQNPQHWNRTQFEILTGKETPFHITLTNLFNDAYRIWTTSYMDRRQTAQNITHEFNTDRKHLNKFYTEAIGRKVYLWADPLWYKFTYGRELNSALTQFDYEFLEESEQGDIRERRRLNFDLVELETITKEEVNLPEENEPLEWIIDEERLKETPQDFFNLPNNWKKIGKETRLFPFVKLNQNENGGYGFEYPKAFIYIQNGEYDNPVKYFSTQESKSSIEEQKAFSSCGLWDWKDQTCSEPNEEWLNIMRENPDSSSYWRYAYYTICNPTIDMVDIKGDYPVTFQGNLDAQRHLAEYAREFNEKFDDVHVKPIGGLIKMYLPKSRFADITRVRIDNRDIEVFDFDRFPCVWKKLVLSVSNEDTNLPRTGVCNGVIYTNLSDKPIRWEGEPLGALASAIIDYAEKRNLEDRISVSIKDSFFLEMKIDPMATSLFGSVIENNEIEILFYSQGFSSMQPVDSTEQSYRGNVAFNTGTPERYKYLFKFREFEQLSVHSLNKTEEIFSQTRGRITDGNNSFTAIKPMNLSSKEFNRYKKGSDYRASARKSSVSIFKQNILHPQESKDYVGRKLIMNEFSDNVNLSTISDNVYSPACFKKPFFSYIKILRNNLPGNEFLLKVTLEIPGIRDLILENVISGDDFASGLVSAWNFNFAFLPEYKNWKAHLISSDMIKIESPLKFESYPILKVEIQDIVENSLNIEEDVVINNEICYTKKNKECYFSRINTRISDIIRNNNLRRKGEPLRIFHNGVNKLSIETPVILEGGVAEHNIRNWGKMDLKFEFSPKGISGGCFYLGLSDSNSDVNFQNCVEINIMAWNADGVPIDENENSLCGGKGNKENGFLKLNYAGSSNKESAIRKIAASINQSVWSDRLHAVAHGEWISLYMNPLYALDWSWSVSGLRLEIQSEYFTAYNIRGEETGEENFSYPFIYHKANLSIFPFETENETESISELNIQIPELQTEEIYNSIKFEVEKSIYNTAYNIRDAINARVSENGKLNNFFAHYNKGDNYVTLLYYPLFDNTNENIEVIAKLKTQGKYQLYLEGSVSECTELNMECGEYEIPLMFSGGSINTPLDIFDEVWDADALNNFDTYKNTPYNECLNYDIYHYLKSISHNGKAPVGWIANEDFLPSKINIEQIREPNEQMKVSYYPINENKLGIVTGNLNKGYELLDKIEGDDIIQSIGEKTESILIPEEGVVMTNYVTPIRLNSYENSNTLHFRLDIYTTIKKEYVFSFQRRTQEQFWKNRFYTEMKGFIENLPFSIKRENDVIYFYPKRDEFNYEIYFSENKINWRYVRRNERFSSILPSETYQEPNEETYNKKVTAFEIHDEYNIEKIDLNGKFYYPKGKLSAWLLSRKIQWLKDGWILKINQKYTSKINGNEVAYVELYSELKEENLYLSVNKINNRLKTLWFSGLEILFKEIDEKLEIRIGNTNYEILFENIYLDKKEKIRQWILENESFLERNRLKAAQAEDILYVYQEEQWIADYEIDAGLFGRFEDRSKILEDKSLKLWESSILKKDPELEDYIHYGFYLGSTLEIYPSTYKFNEGEYRITDVEREKIGLAYNGKMKRENEKLIKQNLTREIIVNNYFKYPTYGIDAEDLNSELRLSWRNQEENPFFLMDLSGLNTERTSGDNIKYEGSVPLYADAPSLYLRNEPNENPNWRFNPEKQQTKFPSVSYKMPKDTEYNDVLYSSAIQAHIGYQDMEEKANNNTLLVEQVFNKRYKLVVTYATDENGQENKINRFEISEDGKIEFTNINVLDENERVGNLLEAGLRDKMNVRISVYDPSSNHKFIFENEIIEGVITQIGDNHLRLKTENKLINENSDKLNQDDQIEMYIEILPMKLGEISMWAESEEEDQRFKVILSNLGADIDPKHKHAYKDSNPKEEGIDWLFMNDKRKELFYMFDDIHNYVGSYRGLTTAVKYFGWSDLELDETWINKNEDSEYFGSKYKTSYPLNNKSTAFQDLKKSPLSKDFFKQPELILIYPATDSDGNWKDSNKTIEELQYQLNHLKRWLWHNMIPMGISKMDASVKVSSPAIQTMIHSWSMNTGFELKERTKYNDFYAKAYKILSSNKTYNIQIYFRQKGKAEKIFIRIKTYRPVRDENGQTVMQLIENKKYYPESYDNINIAIHAEINYAIEISIEDWNNASNPYGRKETYRLQDIID